MLTTFGTLEAPLVVLTTAHRRRDPQRFERKLLLAMVEQALLDARMTSCYGLSGPAIEATHWLQAASEEPFSFRWICRMMNTNPDAAQAHLRGRLQSLPAARIPGVNAHEMVTEIGPSRAQRNLRGRAPHRILSGHFKPRH